MIEQQLLAASFQSRDCLPSLLSCSGSSRDLVTRTVLREAYDYLVRDPLAGRVDKDQLLALVSTKLAPNQYKQAELLVKGAQATASVPNAIELDANIRRNRWADDLLEELGSSSRDWSKIKDLCSAQPETTIKLESLSWEFDDYQQGSIKLGIDSLDAKLGDGLMRGHTVLVFARPEMGKSLLAINIARALAEQGLRGIYFENEEPSSITRQRLLCSIANCTKQELKRVNRSKYAEVVHNITVHQLTPGTLGEIEALSRGYDWVIVNQLRNLSYRDSNKVVALEELAKGMRAIASRNNLLAIQVTQAGDSAEGKRVLTMGDVDFSNTGIPAAMDLMIGIGMDTDTTRCLSLPKNKIGGDHSNTLIKIDPQRSRVVG